MRIAFVVAALALAAPAALADTQPPQALSPTVVPGAGLSGIAGVRAARFRHVDAAGITAAGRFRIDFAAGPGRKLVLTRHGAPVFRALRFTSMRWAARSVSISGFGLAGGVRVHFVALAVDGGARDVFKIGWLHRATLGGVLSHGAVVIH
jgi:hypothetical protein